VQLKRIWAPKHVDLLADRSPEGISLGLEHILDTIRDIVGDRMMSDLCLPLRILTADLQEGEAVVLDNWPVYEAIRAGLSMPGLTRPYRHGSQRLVDAVCLTPVPASFVRGCRHRYVSESAQQTDSYHSAQRRSLDLRLQGEANADYGSSSGDADDASDRHQRSQRLASRHHLNPTLPTFKLA
jgi:predicted acylesterase/phospholipase RssA